MSKIISLRGSFPTHEGFITFLNNHGVRSEVLSEESSPRTYRITRDGKITEGDLEHIKSKMIPLMTRVPRGVRKLTVVSFGIHVVTVCDKLATFFSLGKRSFKYGKNGVEVLLQGISQGVYPSLHEAFESILTSEGWSYCHVLTSLAPQDKVVVVSNLLGHVCGCFGRFSDYLSSFYIRYYATIYKKDGLVVAKLRRITLEAPSIEELAEKMKKYWLVSTPRVIEYLSSSNVGPDVRQEVDALVEKKIDSLKKKAAIVKKLRNLTPTERAILLS